MEYRRIRQQLWRCTFALATASLFIPAKANAGEGLFTRLFCKPKPCYTCPPSMAPVEITAPKPAEPAPSAEPSQPSQAAPEQDQAELPENQIPPIDDSLLDLAASTDFAAASGFSAPNMIGDFFGGLNPSIGGEARIFISGDFRATFVDAVSDGFVDPLTLELEYTHPLGGDIIITDLGSGQSFTVQHDYPGATQGLEEDTGPVGTTEILNIASDESDFNAAAAALQEIVPGAVLVQLDYLVASVTVSEGSSSGLANLAYDASGTVDVRLPIAFVLPAGGRPGAAIAQLKVSENNNVLPQDRFIFNYNYFNSVPLTASGVDVNRFTPGVEKTFFNGLMSVQVAFPFASTVDPAMTMGTSSRSVEFGNIQTIIKGLLYNSPRFKFGAGMGIEVPTADDLSVGLAGGPTLLVLENESVHLQPYIGALYRPTERTFVQSFMQIDVDVNGNPVLANPNLTGLQSIGTLYALPLFLWDTQAGYYFYQSPDPSAMISSVAGMLELHWNTPLASSGGSLEFQGLRASNLLTDFSILNMTVGSTIGLGEQTQLMVGTVFPISDDRSFDYEFAVYLNHFFGRTARERSQRTPSLF